MTWEYVFPMTLSPFTFTSLSPRDKEWGHMSESKAWVEGTPAPSMNDSERRGTSSASGFKNPNPVRRKGSPRGVC